MTCDYDHEFVDQVEEAIFCWINLFYLTTFRVSIKWLVYVLLGESEDQNGEDSALLPLFNI